MAEKKYTLKELQELMALAQTEKAVSPTSQVLHGPGDGGTSTTQFGLFTEPGARPEVLSAVPRIRGAAGLASLEPTVYTNEILEVMTAVSNVAGSNASDFGSAGPTPGTARKARRIFNFGKFKMDTNLNLLPELGQLRDRADVPVTILNAPRNRYPLVPEIMYQMEVGNTTDRQLRYELWLLGIAFERAIETCFISGNTGNSPTVLGFFQQFDGLDQQIKTGYTDAAGNDVDALDSVVITFGQDIGGTDSNSRDMMAALSDLIYSLKDRAAQIGMPGMDFALVMRKELFRELTYTLAGQYASFRLDLSEGTNNRLTVSGEAARQLQLDMERGQYLRVGAFDIPVAVSDAMPFEGQSANNYKTDLYAVPVAFEGMPMMRLQYFDMRAAGVEEYSNFLDADSVDVMNDGLFMAGVARTRGLARQFEFASKMRLVLEAPFLAGRIDDITFNYFAGTRDAYPGGSLYDGGGASYSGAL